MAIFKDFYIGKTHIILRDDDCYKPEEIPAVLEDISRMASIAIFNSSNKMQNDKTA